MCKANEIRCPNCNRKICDATGEFHLKVKCPKCRNEFEHRTDDLNHFEGTTKTLTMLNANGRVYGM